MKDVYWSPRKVSRKTLVAVGLLSIAGITAVESYRPAQCPQGVETKRAAAQLARRSMNAIKQERLRRGHRFSRRFDPAQTGMIGEAMSQVTSMPASLASKQTSVNPNFAAAVVDMLTRAGVEPGDCVAVGYSGSFPALNLCVCAALEVMKAKPIVIASAASSQFGANHPDLLWIDMERILFEKQLTSIRSTRVSIGGFGDRGVGMSDDAIALITRAIERNGLRRLDAPSLTAAIDERMKIFHDEANGMPIKAYVNVGGGAASVRGAAGKQAYAPGLHLCMPADAADVDSVMTRFAKQGIPVVNLARINELASQCDFPKAPVVMPAVGTGRVFAPSPPSRWLAAVVLIGIVGSLRPRAITAPVRTWFAYLDRRRRPTVHIPACQV